MRDVAELPTRGDADIAAVASLLADPARCKVLLALDDGRALPASVLADEAGISRPTASSHLGKLTDAGLLVGRNARQAPLLPAGRSRGRRAARASRSAGAAAPGPVAAGGHPCRAVTLRAYVLRPSRGPARRADHGQPAGPQGARRR